MSKVKIAFLHESLVKIKKSEKIFWNHNPKMNGFFSVYIGHCCFRCPPWKNFLNIFHKLKILSSVCIGRRHLKLSLQENFMQHIWEAKVFSSECTWWCILKYFTLKKSFGSYLTSKRLYYFFYFLYMHDSDF